MLRAVLAVLLAVALLAVSMGALESTRPRRSDRLAAGQVGRLIDAVESLARSEAPVRRRGDAARRVLEVAVPSGDLDSARVEYVSIGGLPDRSVNGDDDRSDVVAYRVAGSDPVVRWLPVDLRVVGPDGPRPDGEPLVLRGSGTVTLSLLRRAGRRVVVAARGG